MDLLSQWKNMSAVLVTENLSVDLRMFPLFVVDCNVCMLYPNRCGLFIKLVFKEK